MRAGLIAAVAAVLAGPALAADLPARMPVKAPVMAPVSAYDWTGFYVGANVGHAWGPDDPVAATEAGATYGPYGTFRNDGWFAGAQAGYNRQFGRLVVGVEGDVQRADIRGSWPRRFGDSNPVNWITADMRVDWFGTLRGRLGYAHDRALLYVTGGLAAAHARYDMRLEFRADGGVADLHSDKTKLGWVVGAGLEYALTSNWSAKLEYQYLHFGSETFTGVRIPAGATVASDYDLALHTVRAGVNYRFGGPVVARY